MSNDKHERPDALLKAVLKTLDEHDPKTKDVLMVAMFLLCRAAHILEMPLEKLLTVTALGYRKYQENEAQDDEDDDGDEDEDDGFFTPNRSNR